MSAVSEIKEFLKAGKNFLLGKEPNKIPLSGLSVGRDDLEIALSEIEKKDTYYDEEVIRSYEQSFASFIDHGQAFSFQSGRVALTAIIKAIGLKPGDKVLVPGYTCVAVTNAFLFEGVEVVFYDIELQTFGPDISSLTEKLKQYPDVKSILIHHLYGLFSRDTLEIVRRFADQYIIIEDCAHGMDVRYMNQHIGSFGHIAFFSTEWSKSISTYRGGLAASNNDVFRKKLETIQAEAPWPSKGLVARILKNFILNYYVGIDNGRWRKKIRYKAKLKEVYLPGTDRLELVGEKPEEYFTRFAAPLAKIGLNQLAKLPRITEKRRRIGNEWMQWTKQQSLSPPLIVNGSNPAFLRYPVMVDASQKKDTAWLNYLNAEIGTWFSGQVHPTGRVIEDCPNAIQAARCCINLPVNFVASL